MTVREIRVSPDGDSVAIRTNWPIDEWNAWGVIHSKHGGEWVVNDRVADWIPMEAGEPPVIPDPVLPDPIVPVPDPEP